MRNKQHQLSSLLAAHGCEFVRFTNSNHQQWRHRETGQLIVISGRLAAPNVVTGYLRQILRTREVKQHERSN